MGNCVTLSREKIIKVVKVDGKVLEYRAPVLVEDLLSSFAGFGVAVSREASQCLAAEQELRVGRVYYLVPLEEEVRGRGKRMKLVLTKKQFEELLSKRTALEEVLQNWEQELCTSWKPKLESIPEGFECC